MKTSDYDPGVIQVVDKAAKLITPTGPVLKKIDANTLGIYDAGETLLKDIQLDNLNMVSLKGTDIGYIEPAELVAPQNFDYNTGIVHYRCGYDALSYRVCMRMPAPNARLKKLTLKLVRIGDIDRIYTVNLRRVSDDSIVQVIGTFNHMDVGVAETDIIFDILPTLWPYIDYECRISIDPAGISTTQYIDALSANAVAPASWYMCKGSAAAWTTETSTAACGITLEYAGSYELVYWS